MREKLREQNKNMKVTLKWLLVRTCAQHQMLEKVEWQTKTESDILLSVEIGLTSLRILVRKPLYILNYLLMLSLSNCLRREAWQKSNTTIDASILCLKIWCCFISYPNFRSTWINLKQSFWQRHAGASEEKMRSVQCHAVRQAAYCEQAVNWNSSYK